MPGLWAGKFSVGETTSKTIAAAISIAAAIASRLHARRGMLALSPLLAASKKKRPQAPPSTEPFHCVVNDTHSLLKIRSCDLSFVPCNG